MNITIKKSANNVAALAEAISECKKSGEASVISLEKDVYDFYIEDAIKRVYYISNTSDFREAPDKTKHIGILFDGAKNITLDGNGSTLLFHGDMTQIVFDKSENIKIKNLFTDFSAPTVCELRVVSVGDGYVDFTTADEHKIIGERLHFYCTGKDNNSCFCVRCEKEACKTHHAAGRFSELKAEEKDGVICLYNFGSEAEIGDTFQYRDTLRTEVGFFAVRSKDISVENVTAYFMHGLGFVGQFTENISFDGFSAVPNKERGRTNSCFADSIHISGCKGLISVKNGTFDGTHDDIINVHGTYLKAMSIDSEKTATVRFCHGQTYGFEAFVAGDEVAFTDNKTLGVIANGKVRKASLISEYEMKLEFEEKIPDGFEAGMTVQNLTWQPSLIFENNKIFNDPTRGCLITTDKKCTVRNNYFYKTNMSAILVACDANSWFESGKVTDLEICGNVFEECADPVIFISPECPVGAEIVNRNINIHDNKFIPAGKTVLDAKNTDGIKLKNNVFAKPQTAVLSGCKNAEIDL